MNNFLKLQNRKLQHIVEKLGLGDKPLLKGEMLKELAPVNGVSLLGALSNIALPEDSLPGGSVTYRRMLSDPQVKACLQTKKFAALSQSWDIHAASESPEDQQIAAFVRTALSGMRGSVLDALYDVLDALAFGVSIIEINYALIETGLNVGRIGLASLKSKDPNGFTFETDAFANVLALRGLDGAAYPPDKFLRYCWLPVYESPLGQSDLQAAYKPWFVKQQLLKWWAKYLARVGEFTARFWTASAPGESKAQGRVLQSSRLVPSLLLFALPLPILSKFSFSPASFAAVGRRILAWTPPTFHILPLKHLAAHGTKIIVCRQDNRPKKLECQEIEQGAWALVVHWVVKRPDPCILSTL